MALLAVDVSNTLTALALWRADGSAEHWAIATDPRRTSDELRVLLTHLLAADGILPAEVDAIVVACVVPALVGTLEATCRAVFDCSPLFVGPGVKSGLRIRTEDPREVGPDRVANAVAALARFGAPVIVLDFSTALTLDVVGPGGDYLGAIIAPGLAVAADALARRTARLHRTDLAPPPAAIASNTDHALQSGLVFGYLGLVEGLVMQVKAEIGAARVVATGDAPWVAEFLANTQVVDSYDPLLTLDGLRLIFMQHDRA